MNPGRYLREHAARSPDAIAMHFPAASYSSDSRRWDAITFGELERRSDAFARGFSAQGIRRGDRTVLLARPNLDFYAFLFGLMKLGAVPVLIDPGMGLKNVLSCIEENRPRCVIAVSAVHAVRSIVKKPFASARVFVTVGRRWWWGGPTLAECEIDGPPLDLEELEPTDDFAIVFTSGSTGTPKGVRWTQRLFAAQVDSVAKMLDMRPGRVQLQCFASFAIQDVCWGQTTVLPKMDLSKPATARPEEIHAAIEAFSPDTAFASPIVWVNLGRWCEEHGKKLPSLERAITTGAEIPVRVHRQYASILREGTQFWTPYGATEAIPVSHIATREILDDTHEETLAGGGTCVGWPAPGITIRIVAVTDDPLATLVSLPVGEIGEIAVAGDQVSPEYADRPGANRAAKVDVDGRVWHRMGDLGRIDERGRLWFCGRKAHRVETVAGMVPPVSVEGVFNDDPRVLRTALVGVGDSGKQIPVLVVQMAPDCRFDANFEAELLARAKDTRWAGCVRRVLVHPDFPVDARHNSKIRREDLAAWAAPRCADLVRGAA